MDELLPESENWCLSITARNVNELENRNDILLVLSILMDNIFIPYYAWLGTYHAGNSTLGQEV